MLFRVNHTISVKGLEVNLDLVPEDPNLEQIWPAHAVHNDKAIDKIADSDVMSEEKLDGERLVLTWKEGVVRATTRRVSVKTGILNEKTNNVPHLRAMYVKELEGTVLDGEVMPSSWGEESGTLGALQSIMNSTPENAIEKQKIEGFVSYRCFDIVKFKGVWVGHLPLRDRIPYLEEVLKILYSEVPESKEFIRRPFSTFGRDAIESTFQTIVSHGGEGTVVKDLSKAYGETNAWLKKKRQKTFDVFVTGYEMSKTGDKYAGQIGTLLVSVYDESGNVIEVGKVIPGTDEERLRFTRNFESVRGSVVEIVAQEVTKNKRFRHGRILRWRLDKSADQCLYSQFIQE